MSHLNMAALIFIWITAVDDKQPLHQIAVLSVHCFNHLKKQKTALTENGIMGKMPGHILRIDNLTWFAGLFWIMQLLVLHALTFEMYMLKSSCVQTYNLWSDVFQFLVFSFYCG